MCLALPQVSSKLFILGSADWTHLAGAGGFKIAPASLLLTVVRWLYFRHFADSASPSRFGIDRCQTAHKEKLITVDSKRTSALHVFKILFFPHR